MSKGSPLDKDVNWKYTGYLHFNVSEKIALIEVRKTAEIAVKQALMNLPSQVKNCPGILRQLRAKRVSVFARDRTGDLLCVRQM